MMQEANTDNSFEIIEKNQNDVQNSDSASAAPPIPMYNPSSINNLLSNIPPPTALPNFITAAAPPPPQPNPLLPTMQTMMTPIVPPEEPTPPLNTSVPQQTSQNVPGAFYPTTFSAAIPPNKGAPLGTALQPITTVPLSTEENTEESQGLISWMKDAVSKGGILSKMAEKAKSSVDSMITTLDPQMREIIYSGGDLDILVASDNEVKISAIREAFQNVFGKATIESIPAISTNVAIQPVGFQAGILAANEKLNYVHNNPNTQSFIVVAVENFVVQIEEEWFDLGVLILKDPLRQVQLKTFTQMTPVPSTIVTLATNETPADYPLKSTGFSNTIDVLLSNNLNSGPEGWHKFLSGVSSRQIILRAAESLAGLYKNSINQQM